MCDNYKKYVRNGLTLFSTKKKQATRNIPTGFLGPGIKSDLIYPKIARFGQNFYIRQISGFLHVYNLNLAWLLLDKRTQKSQYSNYIL